MRKAELKDLNRIMEIVSVTVAGMNAEGNDQWDAEYPQAENFAGDIERGELFVEETDGQINGLICINDIEPAEYSGLPWSSTAKALVLHRMAVASESRMQGIAGRLLAFAETLAKEQGFVYLKTDTFSQNEKMNRLLAKNGYQRIGTMSFRGKAQPFYCYDKCLS